MDKCKALYSLPKNVYIIAGEPANDYRPLSYESSSSALHQETRASWLHDESSIAGGCCNSSVVFDEITTPFLTTKITRDITWVWEACRSSVLCAAINERAPHWSPPLLHENRILHHHMQTMEPIFSGQVPNIHKVLKCSGGASQFILCEKYDMFRKSKLAEFCC